MGLLGERNPNWPESRYVTLKGGEWEKILLKELIPSVVSKGYRGVFLDTADSLFEGKNFVYSVRDVRSSFVAVYGCYDWIFIHN